MNTQSDISLLHQTFCRDVHVLDQQQKYLAISSFNIRMQPNLLHAAARLIADHFRDVTIQVVHGIPNSGHFLATAVALQLGGDVRLHNSRKDNQIPLAWKETIQAQVRTFTGTQNGFDVISGLTFASVRKGEKVLIVDDVCARGETGVRVITAMQAAGAIVVGFGVMADKEFQGGLARVEKLGVPVFSCVRVKSIGVGDQVKLSEH